jgi:peptidoglycan/LPS O-acetylase OafA/YrhL
MKPVDHRRHIAVLDALRFFAALFVVMAHYVHWTIFDQHGGGAVASVFADLSGIGMPLFFLLSGFVIHYNYHPSIARPGGLYQFWVARFSRLYPLFLLLFGFEVALVFYTKNGACGLAPGRHNAGNLFALGYYFTFTQSWFFGTICGRSINYQYYMIGGVAWSLSVEFFFYIAYCLFARRLVAGKSLMRSAAIVAGSFFLLCIYLFLINRHQTQVDQLGVIAFGEVASTGKGYQDSLLRWLYYFFPPIWMPVFMLGAFLCELYRRHQPVIEAAVPMLVQNLLGVGSVFGTFAIFYWAQIVLGPTHPFLGRTSSFLYSLIIAVIIFACVMFPASLLARGLGIRSLALLGQASYSMYLLHAALGRWPREAYGWRINEFSPWLLYVLCVAAICVLSLLSYRLIERPAQRFLRNWLIPDRAPSVSAHSEFQPAAQPR